MLIGILIGALAAAAVRPAAATSCANMMQPRNIAHRRPASEDDLVRLRDIGGAQAPDLGERLFALSPDGRRAALQVHQADPTRNAYCVAIVVLDLKRAARPIVVDHADELIRFSATMRGRLDYPFGLPRAIAPRWSPDGAHVAYLKQVGGRAQAWVAASDASGARLVADLPEGIDDLRYLADGSGLVLASRPDVPARHAALETEGRGGFRYDYRFAPLIRQTPFPPGPAPTSYSTLSLATGSVRPATAEEAKPFAEGVSADGGGATATSIHGDVATLATSPADAMSRSARLTVRRADGMIAACSAPSCEGRLKGLWWTADGSKIGFMRREGDAGDVTATYTWRPGDPAPTRLRAGPDLLFGCAAGAADVLCIRETSTRPRHLVLLDPATGRLRVRFDPNPELRQLELGRVERLHVRDAFGVPLFADLVLPTRYRPGRRYPLVVVQYESRGFLRGGTGDEYPIQVLAGRGFMVLSVNRPSVLSYSGDTRTPLDVDRAILRDFRFRKATHSGVERLIGQLVSRGLVDGSRVGITGLSEGASEVQWALVHDRRFAAAAMSGCCWGPENTWLTGPVAAREYAYKGYPSWADPEGLAFWRELSLVPHASEVRTPLLVQAADQEVLGMLDTYTALSAANAPIDLYVFPDEQHVKFQPAHRLAVYTRAVEWFAFWLQGRSFHPDVARWSSLRTIPGVSGSRPPPDWNKDSVLPFQ